MIREILCSEGVPRTAHAHRSNVTDTFSEPPAAGLLVPRYIYILRCHWWSDWVRLVSQVAV